MIQTIVILLVAQTSWFIFRDIMCCDWQPQLRKNLVRHIEIIQHNSHTLESNNEILQREVKYYRLKIAELEKERNDKGKPF